MEELEIYKLPDGQRVDITNWPEDYKFIWLAQNSDVEQVEANEDDLIGVKPDTSMFGNIMPEIKESEFSSIGIPYQDFDLNKMTNMLFSDEIKDFDRSKEGFDMEETFDLTYNLSLDDLNKKEVQNLILQNYLNPRIVEDFRTGIDGEIGYGKDALNNENSVYNQRDAALFLKQPSIQKALEDNLITKQDLSMGMYPGFTSWVTDTSKNIEGMSGIKTPQGKELSNSEVYEIMWQNDMPFNTDIERFKRKARKKVDRFVLRNPSQIESVINLEKLNEPYIYEEYAEEDTFVDDFFGSESLSIDENFNKKDFNGFLVNRGHKKYLQEALKKIEGFDPKQAEKSKELLKLQGLNLYLNEQVTRDLKQQKLIWERSNPGRDADTEGIQFYISPKNFNPDFIKKWMKTETPYVYNQLEKNQIKLEEEYQNILSTNGNVSTGEFLDKISSNAWIGFWHDFTRPLATYTMDVIPGEYSDDIAENWRRNTLINNFERGDQLRYGYKRGKKLEFPEYGGISYLVDDTDRIYDITNKIEATALLSPEQRNKIISKVRKEGSPGSSASGYGLAFESSRVIGDLFGQIALTRGIGKTKSALGAYTKGMGVLGPTKNFLKSIPVKSVVADAMIAQGTIGFVRGYEDTLLAARSAGLPDDISRELAANASVQTGFWYTITAPISPQTKAQNLLFGKPRQETIQAAVQRYMKDGWKGWNEFFKTQGRKFTTIEGLKETGKGAIRTADMMQREGWKELFQENIQQSGETLVIGDKTNRAAGQKIVKSDYTLQDFIHTSALSFTAGSFMPGAGAVTSSANEQLREFMGWDAVDRFNSLAYMSYNEKDLKALLAKQVDEGLYTQQEVDNLLGEVDQYKNTINHVPPNMSAKAASTILEDIKRLNELENDKKKAPKGFTGFDDEIQSLKDKINNTYYDELTKDQRKGIMAAAEAGVAGKTQYKAFESREEALEYLKNTINKKRKESDEDFEKRLVKTFSLDDDGSFGTFTMQDGVKYAFEFKYNAARADGQGKRMTQTAQHEFFHALINEVVSNDKDAGRLLGRALFNELSKLDLELKVGDESVLPGEFRNRLRGYFNKFEQLKKQIQAAVKNNVMSKSEGDRLINKKHNDTWEEALSLYSEAIGDPDIDLKYDEDAIQKIRNSWRRAMQFIGAKDIDLGSGKAVFDMLIDYNKSVKSGMLKYNRAFRKLGKKKGLTKKEKENLQKEEKEFEGQTLPKLKTKLKKQSEKSERLKKLADVIIEKRKKRAAAAAAISSAKRAATVEKEEESELADDIETRFSMRVDKKLTPDQFKDNINNYYDKELWSTQTGVDSVVFNILQDYNSVIGYKVESQYSNLPNILMEDLIAETEIELLKHIRNFNKEFLMLRTRFKDGLSDKGLSKAEITKRVEAQDLKGYKNNKGKLIKENDNLNGWINSQLNNKIKEALKKPGITTEKFTGEIDERSVGEIDESNVNEQKLKFEKDQELLIELLSTPTFGFVDEDGNPITIETLPLGDRAIVLENIDDPTFTINKRIAAEEDPKIKKQLEQQKRDLKRGLELEATQSRTKAENDELKRLRNFEAYDLGSRGLVKTYEALIVPQKPVDMLIKEVEKQILRAPNIETLQFYNFQNKLQSIIYPLLRRVTFKKGPELDEFMYNNWELLLDVINNPIDPITGQSTYSAKMMPESLKEFNEEGKRIKKKKPTRALFLQTYYGKTKATEIIKRYSKSPVKELKQLAPLEVNVKTGREIGLTGLYDRRTALMELLSNVFVLQQARKSLRSQSFLNEIGNKNTNLYNQLKNDNEMSNVLNDMASGKSSSVKFSMNNSVSEFFKGRTALQQVLMANVMQDAQINTQVKSKRNEIRSSIKFKVPNLGKMKDETIAFYLIDKFSKGYNNFDFINIKNSQGKRVKKLLEEGDVKFSENFNFNEYSKDLSEGVNQIIAENENISPEKAFDNVEARATGKGKDAWIKNLWLPPQDQDYFGLLWMIANARGKKGDQQMQWLKENLFDPYNEGQLALRSARTSTYKNWTALMNKYPGMKIKLAKKIPGNESFTYDDAVRVYLWNKGRMNIPGLNLKNTFELSNIVRKDKELRAFASDVSLLSKQPNGYLEPDENWSASTLLIDVKNKLIDQQRSKYLAGWIQKVDLAFNKDTLNKLQAVFGEEYRVSLEDMLYRMKTGKNRSKTAQDKATTSWLNWLNNSVGVTMFFNMRSALLQTISSMNFINTSDNNPLMFGLAVGNLPQFRKDFMELWNSDYLVDRRQGMLNSLQEQEIQDIVRNVKNTDNFTMFNNLISWALKKGFLPTRLADSFAIAFGGATFYRNRINTYIKDGFNKVDSEQKAFFDFFEIAEESQQSGDPSKISMVQAGDMGRLMLAFQNTPLQYGRIIKRASKDLIAGRGNALNNATKILYYGGLQYALFAYLQNALFAKLFDDDEDKWPTGKYDRQQQRVWNGWLDSQLRGSGLRLAYLAWIKNIVINEVNLQNDPSAMYKGAHRVNALIDGLIPLSIKTRKITRSLENLQWNKKESDWLIEKHGYFSLKNPYMVKATLGVIEGFTNVPTARLYQKLENVKNAMSSDFENWQRVMFMIGYTTWNLGLGKDGPKRKGSSNPLDFGPNIDFEQDLDINPKIDF